MDTSFDQRDCDDTTAPEVAEFLGKLEILEGNETPLFPGDFEIFRRTPSFRGCLWSLSESQAGAQPGGSPPDRATPVGLGIYQCEITPELFTACLPDHREMSLFLPMLQWADALAGKSHPSEDLTVWAWQQDICTPYLLLRLNFRPGGAPVQRGDLERVPYIAPIGMVTNLNSAGA